MRRSCPCRPRQSRKRRAELNSSKSIASTNFLKRRSKNSNPQNNLKRSHTIELRGMSPVSHVRGARHGQISIQSCPQLVQHKSGNTFFTLARTRQFRCRQFPAKRRHCRDLLVDKHDLHKHFRITTNGRDRYRSRLDWDSHRNYFRSRIQFRYQLASTLRIQPGYHPARGKCRQHVHSIGPDRRWLILSPVHEHKWNWNHQRLSSKQSLQQLRGNHNGFSTMAPTGQR